MTEAGIEDLLRHEDDSREQESTELGWWVRNILTVAGLTLVAVIGLRLYGIAVPLVAVVAGILALVAVRRVTKLVAAPPATRTRAYRPRPDDGSYLFGELDTLRLAVRTWQRRLHSAHREPKRFGRTVQPALAELVDERLRQRYGITRASDPGRARALLGDPLWQLLTGRVTRTPTPQEYLAILAHLEKL